MPPDPEESPSEDGCSPLSISPDPLQRRNLRVESWFSVFNGVFMGMILFAAPAIVYAVLNATPLELTIIASAFPCGAFLGPLWMRLGRHLGMKNLVLLMALLANLPLFLMYWVHDSAWFTGIVSVSQLLHSAMRMGQSSMYRATYPRPQLGRALGVLTFWTFVTMVPTVLLAGWLSDRERLPDSYRWLFPLAGLSGLIACRFYAQIRMPHGSRELRANSSLRSGLLQVHRVVVSDRAYMLFQLAFFLSGSAVFMSNHITLMLTHDVLAFETPQLALWLSVVPQLLLALCSPVWGHVLDRIGIVRARLLVTIILTIYLVCYFGAIASGMPWLIYLGSVLRGISEGGGQLTWSIASVHFAPRPEDVPLYNGIHFVLNGIRGLLMPALGTKLFLLMNQWTIFTAALVSAAGVAVLTRSLRYGDGPEELVPDSDDVEEIMDQPTAEAR